MTLAKDESYLTIGMTKGYITFLRLCNVDLIKGNTKKKKKKIK